MRAWHVLDPNLQIITMIITVQQIMTRVVLIPCARSTSRSSEQSTEHRSHSVNMRKVCLFYNRNNEIAWVIKHDGHIFWAIHEVHKGLWAFFLDCAFRVLIGWAANYDHVTVSHRRILTCFSSDRTNRGRSRREYGAMSWVFCGWLATDVR